MKLKIEKKIVAQSYRVICEVANGLEFHNTLFQDWYRSALQSLITKLNTAIDRIRKRLTLQLNESQALALHYACGMFLEHYQQGIEALTAQSFLTAVNQLNEST